MIMVNITLSVPAEMKKEMDKFPEMDWSEVARQAIREKLKDLKSMEEVRLRGPLADDDPIGYGRRFGRALARRRKRDS